MDVVAVARVGPFKYFGILTRDGTTELWQQQGIAHHVTKQHETDWENKNFLHSASHWRRTKITEAFYIDSLNQGTFNNIMNLEKDWIFPVAGWNSIQM